MKPYLEAHDALISWLDHVKTGELTIPDVDARLWALASCAANRGMTSIHWTFVVDGLVAYVNRHRPGNILLSSYVARGFDLSERWDDVRRAVQPRATG